MVKANHALSNSAPCSLTSEVFSRTCWVLSSPAALARLAAERMMYINAHACRTFLYHCWENEAYTCAELVIRFLAERHKTLVKRFAGETTAHRIITFLLSSLSAAKMIEGIASDAYTLSDSFSCRHQKLSRYSQYEHNVPSIPAICDSTL